MGVRMCMGMRMRTCIFPAQARRAIHAREHFMTNIATAGGLLLLQKLGGGKCTRDSR